MKKAIKIILPSAALAISVLFWVYTINMVVTVNGERIFFLNSALGSFYASAYRIFAAISLVLLIVWILAAVKTIPKFIALVKSKSAKKEQINEDGKGDLAKHGNDSLIEANVIDEGAVAQVPQTDTSVTAVVEPSEPVTVSADVPPDAGSGSAVAANTTPDSGVADGTKKCAKCEKLISAQAKFCPFCGNKFQ